MAEERNGDEAKKQQKERANTSKEKNSPVKSAKDALNAVSGLPSINVDDLINNLLKNTEDSVMNNVDWKSVYQALSSDDKNSDINDIIKDISSLDFISSSSHMERLNKYKDFLMIIKKLPIIKKILRVYTTNILSPDDISKVSLKTVPKNPTINKTSEEYVSIESKFKVILDKLNFEDHLYNIVFKTLFFGDMFIEILSSKRYLMQTIYNMQIPIKDGNLKLNESNLDDVYDNSTVVNMDFTDDDKVYHVNFEWAKPLGEQLSETMDFAGMYFKAALDHLNITEGNLPRARRMGALNYLAEEFFGSTNVLRDRQTFRAFNEDYDSYMNSMIRRQNPDRSYQQYADDDESLEKRFALDYLPVQSTLSSLNMKIHTPDKIIVLKDEEVEYGYLYVSGGIENGANAGANSGSNSKIGANSIGAAAIVNSSNFMTSSNARMAMFGGSSNQNGQNMQKLNHAQQISSRIATYIKDKFTEYDGDVNIDNMSTNLQMLIADILNKGSETITVRYIPPLNMQQFKIEGTGLNLPYGESVVEDLLFRAKMLLADDINNIIGKYTSTGKRLVWKVNANTHQQAANRIQQASRAINKKTVGVDNCLDTMASAIFPNDNVFIAKINGEPEVELETVDLGNPQDNEGNTNNLIKQLITGADIPPAHLGYEEFVSGKNTLSTENVVFAQTIIGFQKQFGTAITNLMQKAYTAIYSYTNEFNVNFKNVLIALNSPRGISLSFYAENFANLNSIIEFLKDLEIPKKIIINMFWPELFDNITEAEIMTAELNKEFKMQQNGDSGNDMGGGDLMSGGGFVGGGTGPSGELSAGDLEGMIGGEGGGETPPMA